MVWEGACGLTVTVVERVRFYDTKDVIVVPARPDAKARESLRPMRPAVTGL